MHITYTQIIPYNLIAQPREPIVLVNGGANEITANLNTSELLLHNKKKNNVEHFGRRFWGEKEEIGKKK